jgi:hypothetical protein
MGKFTAASLAAGTTPRCCTPFHMIDAMRSSDEALNWTITQLMDAVAAES